MRVPSGLRTRDGEPILVLAEGTQVGPYRLTYKGLGGSSITYLGEGPSGTVRFVKETRDEDESARLALERERTYLAALDHPGVVKFHQALQQDGHSYLVVELLNGQDLEQLIRKQGDKLLEEATVLDWARQIVDIFVYLHAQDPPLIYRDLKPNNLICTDQGRIVLIDFGSVRHFKKGKDKDTDPFGTVMTASPEHYGGQTDERSDIYCFGATLHYLLSNGSPNKFFFDFPDIRESNPDASAAFCDLIERCIERLPVNRFQSFSEIQLALSQLTFAPKREPSG